MHDNPNSPKISICLPTLNAERFLGDRLSSIESQTYKNWELIVCDSHSSDNTLSVINDWSKRIEQHVHLHTVPKNGLYAGWNDCLKRVNGEWIYMATADDTMYPDALQSLIAHITPKGPKLISCECDYIDEHNNSLNQPYESLHDLFSSSRSPQIRDNAAELIVHMNAGISWTSYTALLFSKALLKETGLFDEQYGVMADRPWAYRAALHSKSIHLSEKLATWRKHAGQASNSISSTEYKAHYRHSKDFLKNNADQLPISVRQLNNFEHRLLWGAKKDFRNSLHLNRQSLKQSPRRFAEGLLRGAILAPSYTIRRLATVLSWNAEEHIQTNQYVAQLLHELDVDWISKDLY